MFRRTSTVQAGAGTASHLMALLMPGTSHQVLRPLGPDEERRPHPAAFPDSIIKVLRTCIPRGVVLDPFGGTGRLGRMGPGWTVISHELEPEWAAQGYDHGCAMCLVGDAGHLPFGDGSIPTVATSPAYGNRLADDYVPRDPGARSHKTRRTYRLSLGRPLHVGSGAALPFGAAYRALHQRAMAEAHRVLGPGGTLVLNAKDSIRGGERQDVCAWFFGVLDDLGFENVELHEVRLKGDQNTVRAKLQGRRTVGYEEVTVWRKRGQVPEVMGSTV